MRDAGWKCPFCEFIATRAEQALRDEKTDKEILKFLRTECHKLPQSFAGPCVQYVKEDGAAPLAVLLLGTSFAVGPRWAHPRHVRGAWMAAMLSHDCCRALCRAHRAGDAGDDAARRGVRAPGRLR